MELARSLKKLFDKEMYHSDEKDEEQYKYFVSDSVEGFENLASAFLDKNINGKAKKIDIEKY